MEIPQKSAKYVCIREPIKQERREAYNAGSEPTKRDGTTNIKRCAQVEANKEYIVVEEKRLADAREGGTEGQSPRLAGEYIRRT